ncbi:MAG TPA: plastocyanin/azurin family copper-binding protein [Gemmatimonadales bacterium]|nr:plastocyanin/azurin family copper-binding protein [Gemmatimonadales bacterium]
MSTTWYRIVLPCLCAAAACGGAKSSPEGSSDAQPAAAAAQSAPAPTGKVIEMKAITDDKGNYFSPAKLEAHRGDVIRVVLVSGVHNVHFPADKNPGATDLPDASDLLQLPNQTLDIPVTFKPGTYHFQCDPHAALGMTGELEVED